MSILPALCPQLPGQSVIKGWVEKESWAALSPCCSVQSVSIRDWLIWESSRDGKDVRELSSLCPSTGKRSSWGCSLVGIGASPFHGLPKLGLAWPQSPLMPLVIQLHPASPVSCMWKLGHLKKLSLPSSPLYVGFFIATLRLANSLSIISEKPCSPFPTVHKRMSLHLCPAVLMTTLSACQLGLH